MAKVATGYALTPSFSGTSLSKAWYIDPFLWSMLHSELLLTLVPLLLLVLPLEGWLV